MIDHRQALRMLLLQLLLLPFHSTKKTSNLVEEERKETLPASWYVSSIL
jgi:hypothetical protein